MVTAWRRKLQADRQNCKSQQSFEKHIPHTSKSALEKILKHIKDEGLPELDNSKQMREGCQTVLNNMQRYGPLLLEHQLVNSTGGLSKVILVNLLSWLHGAYKAGKGFHALLKSTMACNPGPLSLLVYADEVCPGNVLSHPPARKLWCIYVSIKQFHTALQKEAAWITVGLVRSDVVASLDGHLSAVLAALLGSIFNSDFGNVTHLGLLLQEPPGQASLGNRLFLDLSFFIMDGQAAKFAWATKGDSGSRFCQQCANVFQITADPDLELKMNQHPCQKLQNIKNLQTSTWYLMLKSFQAGIEWKADLMMWANRIFSFGSKD